MSKQSAADSEEKGTRGSSKQQAQLLVLLLLAAGFGYIYYFTGLIKPRQETPSKGEQVAAIKKPMPPRMEQKPAAGAGEQSKTVPTANAPAIAANAPAPAANVPNPSAAQNPAVSKPAVAPAIPKHEDAKTAKAEVPAKTETPQQSAKTDKAPATAKAKVAAKESAKVPETADKKAGRQLDVARAKTVAQQPASPVKAVVKSAALVEKPALKSEGKSNVGIFVVKVGEFPLLNDVTVAKAKLKKAGIAPVTEQKIFKTEPMHRLFYVEHADRESAVADLEQLRAKAPDAFVLPEHGKFAVYAGSYFNQGRGVSEQARLHDKGVKLEIRKTQVNIPVTVISAGNFTSKGDAVAAVAKLKKQGVNAAVAKLNKKEKTFNQ